MISLLFNLRRCGTKTRYWLEKTRTFDNNLVLLNKIDGGAQPPNITLTHCPFWVQMYNLPMDSMIERRNRILGGGIGELL